MKIVKKKKPGGEGEGGKGIGDEEEKKPERSKWGRRRVRPKGSRSPREKEDRGLRRNRGPAIKKSCQRGEPYGERAEGRGTKRNLGNCIVHQAGRKKKGAVDVNGGISGDTNWGGKSQRPGSCSTFEGPILGARQVAEEEREKKKTGGEEKRSEKKKEGKQGKKFDNPPEVGLIIGAKSQGEREKKKGMDKTEDGEEGRKSMQVPEWVVKIGHIVGNKEGNKGGGQKSGPRPVGQGTST